MKHTPGPWHFVETEPGIDAEMDVFTPAPRYAGGIALVARVMHADDAALIAAAPDLLDALQQCLKCVDAHRRVSGGDGDITAMNARAAIAKAKGQA